MGSTFNKINYKVHRALKKGPQLIGYSPETFRGGEYHNETRSLGAARLGSRH